jgi:hypothetical protein
MISILGGLVSLALLSVGGRGGVCCPRRGLTSQGV